MKTKLFLLIGCAGLLFSCSKEKIDPAYMGKIERDQISIVTKVPGNIEDLIVVQGDFVKKGDTLGVLEIPEVDAKKSQAEGAKKSAEAQYQMAVKGATDAQLNQLKNKLDGHKEQFDYAKKSKERLDKMLEDSLVPQQKYDEVYAKYMGAKNQFEATQTEYEDAKRGARIEQQDMALGQQLQAYGAIAEVDAAYKEKFMIAPQDMSIESINLKVGELALPGYPIFSGYIQNSVYFRFTIAEEKLGELKKGDAVKIKVIHQDRDLIDGKISAIKALNSYADIATAYPDFDLEQTLFEVEVRPDDAEKVKDLITKSTVSLKLEE